MQLFLSISPDFNYSGDLILRSVIVRMTSLWKDQLEYPVKTLNKNLGLFLKLVPNQYRTGNSMNIFENVHRSDVKDGFHLIFHDPFEIPSESSSYFQAVSNRTLNYFVTPELAEIDESLLDYLPEE